MGQSSSHNLMDATMRDGMRNRTASWLPRRRKPIVGGNKFMSWAKTNKGRDWFLGLANAISDRDATQAKMLIKFYIFVLEYMPQGLTGEYAHIRGDDVMAYLLPETSCEISASRHRHWRDSELALICLEAWQKKGSSWEEALNVAADASHPIDLDVDSPEPHPWKAPGLFSPASLLALLVIAHPDDKMHGWVGRLEIGWMLQDRDTLEVREGFWKGITAKNFHTCFITEKNRPKNLPLLAPYTQLFKCFAAARTNMRPDLPTNLTFRLDQTPMDLGDIGNINGNGTPARTLRGHLYPDPKAKPQDELEKWLIDNLASSRLPVTVATQWCRDWATRISQAENYEVQSIRRSLFEQSLRRLESIATARDAVGVATGVGTHVVEAYLLLDKGDLELKQPAELEDPYGKRTVNDKIQSYQSYKETAAQLCRAVQSQHARDLVARIATQQGQYFFSILKRPDLHSLWNEVILLDTGRIQAILQRHDEAQQRREMMELHENLLRDDKIKSLQLTAWQIRNLALPCELSQVLTKDQLQVVDPEPGPSGMEFIDVSKVLPVTPRRDPRPGEDATLHDTFKQLFGNIHLIGDDGTNSPRQPSRQLSQGPSQRPQQTSRKTPASHSANGSASADSGFNLYAGKTYVPAKRSADGNVKATSRLWSLSRDDLREDLNTVRQGLAEEITNKMTCELDKMREKTRKALKEELSEQHKQQLSQLRDVIIRERSEQLKQQLFQLRDNIKNAHQKDLQNTQSALEKELHKMDGTHTKLSEMVTSLVHEKDQVAAWRQSMEQQLEQLKTQLQHVQDRLETATATATAGRPQDPELGQDGYLQRHCHAPEGIEQQDCKNPPMIA